MEFKSEELKNVSESPSSITHVSSPFIDMKSIKEDMRIFLLTKNKDLLPVYDRAMLSRSVADNGNSNLKDIIQILKDFYSTKYKDDNVKNLTCRKIFDTINLGLDCLMINGIETSSDEINTLILGFLTKNFL
jgi:hypothetical protein